MPSNGSPLPPRISVTIFVLLVKKNFLLPRPPLLSPAVVGAMQVGGSGSRPAQCWKPNPSGVLPSQEPNEGTSDTQYWGPRFLQYCCP